MTWKRFDSRSHNSVTRTLTLLDAVETHPLPRYEREVLLLRARAALELGRPSGEVERIVESAPMIAEPHRFVRTLLVDGGPLDEVLRAILRRAPHDPYRAMLMEHLRSRTPVPRAVENPGNPFLPSSREREVLRYLVTGLFNREIAGELYISVNTMKTHVRSLHRQLGVSSRPQADAAARDRRLI